MNPVASYTHIERDLGEGGYATWSSMRRYRYALRNLIMKDFRIRYRNMSLGVLWSVINPLVMLGVLMIVFTHIHPNRHVHYFPVFLLIGLVLHNFVAMVLPPATNSILTNASLIKKVIFPRALIPVAVVFSQLIHVGIMMVLLAAFMVFYSVPLYWTSLWVLPVVLTMLVFALGISLVCSAMAVHFRDALYVVESGLKLAFWLTPVFYDLLQVKLGLPKLLYWLYLLNPMAGCIDGARKALLRGQHPDPEAFGFAVASSLVIFVLGLVIFQHKQKSFADYL